jgi:hypothetical protein
MTGEERAARILDSVSVALLDHLGLVTDRDVAEQVLVELNAWEQMDAAPSGTLVHRLGALANLVRALRLAAEAQGWSSSANRLRRHEDVVMGLRDAIAGRLATQR